MIYFQATLKFKLNFVSYIGFGKSVLIYRTVQETLVEIGRNGILVEKVIYR